MVEAAVAEVTIIPVSKGATRQIEEQLGGEKAGRKVGSQVGSGLTDTLGKTLKGAATATVAAAATGIGIALTKGFARLNAIDTARAKLTGLGNDTAAVDNIMASALESVSGTAFGLGDAATTAAGAVAAGIKPGKDLTRVLTSVANSAAAAGVDLNEMGGIYNKVASVGKAQNDVLSQVADRGIPIYQALAEQLGVTTDEVFKMASAGKIGFNEFETAMTSASGTVAEEMGKTITGSAANFFASLGRIGANAMSGFFPTIAPAIQTLTASMKPLETAANGIGAALAERVNPFMDKFMGLVKGGLPDLSRYSSILGPATAAFAALGASGLAPLFRLIPGLGGFAGALSALAGPAGIAIAVLGGLIAVSPELQAAFGGLFASIGGLVEALMPSITTLATLITGALIVAADILAATLVVAVDVLSGFAGWLTTVADYIVPLAVAVGVAVVAFKAWTLATKAWVATAALVRGIQTAYIAMTYGQVGATYAGAAAQRVLNAAMAANPIGIIVTAIAALVAGLIYFFTQTELGQEIWANFTQFLGEAWENVSGWIVGAFEAVVGFFSEAWANITGFFTDAYNGVIKPIIDGIAAVFSWLYENIIRPVIFGIMLYIGLWAALFTWLYNTIIKPVIDGIAAVILWVWTNVISPVVDWIKAAFTVLGIAISIAVNAIKGVWTTVWGAISSFFKGIWNAIVGIVRTQINIVLAIVRTVVNTVKSVWTTVWSGISSFFGKIWKGITDTVTRFKGIFEGVFSGIKGFVTSAFSGVLGAVKGPLNGIIGIINSAIGSLNKIKVDIPDWVPMVGGQTFGLNLPKIPQLATGAIVRATSGGSLANIGEGRYDEAVVPLGGPQFARLAEALNEGGRGATVNQTINVKDQDPRPVIAFASRQLRSMGRMA